MGLVRYFPHEELKDLVIVDPQILFEKVNELIVETFTFENISNYSSLEMFKNMGIFNLSDFTRISSRTGQNLTPTLFAKLLEYLRIYSCSISTRWNHKVLFAMCAYSCKSEGHCSTLNTTTIGSYI